MRFSGKRRISVFSSKRHHSSLQCWTWS